MRRSIPKRPTQAMNRMLHEFGKPIETGIATHEQWEGTKDEIAPSALDAPFLLSADRPQLATHAPLQINEIGDFYQGGPATPKRPRKAQPEAAIQRSVLAYLTKALPQPHLVVAIPNGQASDAGRMWASRLGQVAGFPDLQILVGGRTLFMECKSAVGRLSDAQKAVHARVTACGFPAPAVVRSIADAEAALRGWGVVVRGKLSL